MEARQGSHQEKGAAHWLRGARAEADERSEKVLCRLPLDVDECLRWEEHLSGVPGCEQVCSLAVSFSGVGVLPCILKSLGAEEWAMHHSPVEVAITCSVDGGRAADIVYPDCYEAFDSFPQPPSGILLHSGVDNWLMGRMGKWVTGHTQRMVANSSF
ncbi:hypothetical protein QYF61_015934 [Mycteria americana]|uniref:Uncharacterized protein n=1 Tax=Mycteria americana TaxID=33587 RepID=A0AAN7RTW8_MYCAM|nr:hypothetical protein QYF61_015934 [Mycteria americana]